MLVLASDVQDDSLGFAYDIVLGLVFHFVVDFSFFGLRQAFLPGILQRNCRVQIVTSDLRRV